MYLWPIWLCLMLFLLLLFLPFWPGLLEYLKPRDDQPLAVKMLYAKDPCYFAKSFQAMLKKAMSSLIITSGEVLVKLSKEERLKITFQKVIGQGEESCCLFFCTGDVCTEAGLSFPKEVYVVGHTQVGEENVLRAIYSQGNLLLGPKVRIIRWAHAEHDIVVAGNSYLGVSLTCLGQLTLGRGCIFQRLYGNPVRTCPAKAADKGNQDQATGLILCSSARVAETTIMAQDQNKKDFGLGQQVEPKTGDLQQGSVKDKALSEIGLGGGSQRKVIQGQIISRQPVVIEPGSLVEGSIKSYQGIVIGDGALVQGNLFAEGGVKVGCRVSIFGHIFSQGVVEIGSGTQIGKEGKIKSVIAKKGLMLQSEVVIWGYVMCPAEGQSL